MSQNVKEKPHDQKMTIFKKKEHFHHFIRSTQSLLHWNILITITWQLTIMSTIDVSIFRWSLGFPNRRYMICIVSLLLSSHDSNDYHDHFIPFWYNFTEAETQVNDIIL